MQKDLIPFICYPEGGSIRFHAIDVVRFRLDYTNYNKAPVDIDLLVQEIARRYDFDLRKW